MDEIKDLIKATYHYKNGELYPTRTSRRALTTADVIELVSSRLPDISISFANINGLIHDSILEIEAQIANEADLNQVQFANEIDFVKSVLRSHGIDTNYRGDKFHQVLLNGNSRDIELSAVEDYLKFEIGSYNRTAPRTNRFQIGSVLAALGVLLHETNNNMFAGLQVKLAYDPICADKVDPLIQRIIKVMKLKGDPEVLCVVFKHFFWLVKRNLFSKKTINELWLAFFGAQACGKNYMAKYVFAGPLIEFYVETELNKLGDIDREIRKFTDNLIVNFDELALGSGEATHRINDNLLQNLKTIVTRTEMTFRQMGGQKQIKLDKKFVPISTANHHLYDIIYDSTGMRRFFEMDSEQPAGVQFDNTEVADIASHMFELYKGIDEDNERGFLDFYTPIGKKIQAIQKSYKPKTSIDEWIVENQIVKSDVSIKATDLYANYSKFTTACGYSRFGHRNFIVHLKELFGDETQHGATYIFADIKREEKPKFRTVDPFLSDEGSVF